LQVADLPTLAYCDVVVITAGAKQRKDEPRTALVDRNAKILDSIIKGMFPHRSPPNPDLILLLVSNPVDVLTSVAQHLTQGILPSNQVR
jgi:L-lactate dehydrogenase